MRAMTERSGDSVDARAARASGRPLHIARRWAAVVVIALAVISAFAYVLPRGSRNPLVETTLWSLLVVVAFAGWGTLVRFFVGRDEKVDLGLRILWGASLLCGIGGLLASLAWMGRTATLFLVEAGVTLAIAALARERAALRIRLLGTWRGARREPRLALFALLVAVVVALHYLAGVSEWHTNPYDDDIAYLSFVRKMLDTGTLLEPFSLRRLSALGGQTFFQELVAVRAAPSQGHTFDRSIALLMVVLLIIGHRTKARRLPWGVSIATVTLFLILPVLAINTASYYSGVAFFLGLARTLSWLGQRERAAWQNALPVALIGAAACTLRQNYIVVPAAMLAVSYSSRALVRGRPMSWRLVEPALTAAFSFAFLLPWFAVAYRSNQTFFYPVMLGTANPATQFQSGTSTGLREIYLQIWTLLEGFPLKSMGFFALAAALVRETAPRKPLWALLLGCATGLVALVHGLTQGDAPNIGRYAFGFVMALPFAVVLFVGTVRFGPRPSREHAAAALAAFGVAIGLVESRADLYKFYDRATHNIEVLGRSAPRSPATAPPESALYERLQASVPAGARLAVLLDEPYHLDFARNPIWNLDMPGYSSLSPGLPYFTGDKAVEAYFRGLGVRYLAYVRIGYSRYHYRREYWVQGVGDEQEVWRAHAPYEIDFLDNLTAIDSRHHRLFDERGLVVIDLEASP